MSDKSGIEWTDATWNPTVGCTKVSPGCDHCYAETLVNRFAGHNKGFPNRFDVMTLRGEDHLTLPLRWQKPRRVFVNSLSDLFHQDVPDEFIARVFAVMALAGQHTFQLLTKRHARMRSLLSDEDFTATVAQTVVGWSVEMGIELPEHLVLPERPSWWPLPNVWLGVSVENQQWADIRIPALLDTPAVVRFLSCEPLLGPVDLSKATDAYDAVDCVYWKYPWLSRIKWVIAGGESGPGARPMHTDWAEALRNQCVAASVPFLFKQHGEYIGYAKGGTPDGRGRSAWADRDCDTWVNVDTGATADEETALAAGGSWKGVWRVGKKRAGRELDGRTWDEYPAVVHA